MKFVCLSDIHLSSENSEARLDNLVETQFEKLEFVLKLAMGEKAAILQAGDMFHRPRSWLLLPIVIDLLKKYAVSIYAVFGQHDTYFYSTETKDRTSLGILVKAGLFMPLSIDKPVIVQGVALYGANFGQNLCDLKRSREGYTIGVIHHSISDKPLWPGHQFTPADKYLEDNPDYDFILVGDIHRRFEVKSKDGRQLINTGPMLRREATEYNFDHKPSVYLLDTEDPKKSKWIEIPHKPANQVLSRDHIERKAEADNLLDEFVKAIGTDDVDGVSFIENLMAFSKANKVDQKVMDVIAKFVERTNREGL